MWFSFDVVSCPRSVADATKHDEPLCAHRGCATWQRGRRRQEDRRPSTARACVRRPRRGSGPRRRARRSRSGRRSTGGVEIDTTDTPRGGGGERAANEYVSFRYRPTAGGRRARFPGCCALCSRLRDALGPLQPSIELAQSSKRPAVTDRAVPRSAGSSSAARGPGLPRARMR